MEWGNYEPAVEVLQQKISEHVQEHAQTAGERRRVGSLAEQPLPELAQRRVQLDDGCGKARALFLAEHA